MQLEYKGEIKEGKLFIVDQQQLIKDIAAHTIDCQVTIIIKKRYNKRTDGQNKYYRGVVVPRVMQGIRDVWGEYFDADEVHDYLKNKFNCRTLLNEDSGEVLDIGRSTSKLDTKEFSEFIDKVKLFSIEMLGVDIDADEEKPQEKKSQFASRPKPTFE